jgi:hypothetical protein
VCIGDKVAHHKSTIIVEQDDAGTYTVAVLAGQAEIDEAEPLVDSNYDILRRYPSIGSTIGAGTAGYANAYPSSGGLIVGSVDYFLPLAQHRASSILYSYTATGSNFDGYWGVSTEIGYRWFTPSDKSATSLYIGYSGFDSPSCFNNLVNLGGGWEKGRWRLGATAGLKTGGCDAGFNFGSINISAPIAKFNQIRTAYLSFTPYLIWGDNILSLSNYDGSGSSVSPGAKLSLNAPVSESVSVGTYASIDTINGVSIGGLLKVRFPTGGKIIRDPNLDPQAQEAIANEQQQSASLSTNSVVIDEAYKANFTASGDQIGETVKLKPEEIIAYITDYLEGTTPLAEGNRIAKVAEENQALTTKVAAILGRQFLEIASLPVSVTSQPPFDINNFPTTPYACVVTDAAKDYAVRRLIEDGKYDTAAKVAAADKVYYGRGDKVSNGWPVATSPSQAYRFGNGASCRRLNSIIESSSSYDGPSNPVSTEILN